jgi:prophage regulatory protein
MPVPPKLLNQAAVLEQVTFSRSTLLNRVKDGTFPAPLRLSARRVAWLESDVMNWIAGLQKVEAL